MVLSTTSLILDPVEASTSGRALACSGNVCLNEAMPNPTGYDDATWPGGEWMEIYNSGTTAVDVLNWELINKASKSLTFDSSSIVGYESGNSSTWTIQPGDYMIIATNGSANFYLTNTGGDWITMNDASGNTVDQASWNSTASGVSLEEDPNNAVNDWISTNNPTPGAANSAATGPVVSDISFSEVMPNPHFTMDNESWPGGEWIEIHNSGTTEVNLSGWEIVDNAGNAIPLNESHIVGQADSIAPDEYLVIAVNTTGAWGVLNNGAESIRLLLPNGSITDQISWSTTQSGYSLVKHNDGSWSTSSYPTPGQPNPKLWNDIIDLSSDIMITEVLANSSKDGFAYPEGEWVELYNSGNSDLDLMDWKLRDGMGNMTMISMPNLVMNSSQPGTIIKADSRRLVQFTENVQLWDNYNQLMLLNQMDQVVDKAWWISDPGLNNTLIESQDSSLPWVVSSWPTPGQPEPGTTSVTGMIAFNEVFPDAVGNDTNVWPNGEWIELINTGNQSVDIANWYFKSGSRNFNINVIQLPEKSSTIVNPGEVFVVAINGTQNFYLRNTPPELIELRDSSNQVVSTLSYNITVEGESLWHWNGDWSQSPWPTPGEDNPQTSPYLGETTITVTEIMAHCSSDNIDPLDDWFELHNNGTQEINLSAWRITSSDGDLIHLRPERLWNSTDLLIQQDERLVFTAPNWFVSGLGDSITLEDPDGNEVDVVTWTVTTDCKSMDGNGSVLPWPTPGEIEPDISSFSGPEDLLFSRFMFQESSQTTNDEFFEITNIGNKTAVLNGWVVRRITTTGQTFNGTFSSLVIESGESVIVSPDASSIRAMEQSEVVDADEYMDSPVWLYDSGATIQLVSPMGIIADTFVYGNGPTDVVGWSGPSISDPITSVDRILFLRGDGCGEMPDTNKSDDWEIRWSVASASHFCGVNSFSDITNVTPLIAPESGIDNVIEMIDNSETSIHLHVYQLHHSYLVQSLIDAKQRGVDVVIVIHEPENWWSEYDVSQSEGMAWELENSGINVLQFSSSSSSPYQYLHSKIAVVDSEFVWIGSGNWKESSMPSDRDGNRDWGVIVQSEDLAQITLDRLMFDEDPSQLHIEDATFNEPAEGSYTPPISHANQFDDIKPAIYGPISGELLTCPDDCVQGLANLISNANSEILLSLQYFEMDWYWGWQTNPLLDSLEDAADRGVSIRLVINQHYVNDNPGIREAVNELNSWSGDVEAVLMSENDTVKKLHNKGMIIDGEMVLVSSINWGDNSILRNREMGLVIQSQAVAEVYENSFWDDWSRMDNTTDTDIDGIPDYWEIDNGLQRTVKDADDDNDGDGLSNEGEFSYGSNPNSNDTDGDCILDSDEIIWAGTQGLLASDALNSEDADGDGEKDSDTFGCKPDVVIEPVDSDDDGVEDDSDNCPNTLQGADVDANGCSDAQNNVDDNNDVDTDNDGIIDSEDDCPDTELEAAVDTQGCSDKQNREQSSSGTSSSEGSSGLDFMITLIILGSLVFAGALVLFLRKDKPEQFDSGVVSHDISEDKSYEMPALDGSSEAVEGSGPDMSKFPGWDISQVEKYLESGWTEQQLEEWYQQQMEQNSA